MLYAQCVGLAKVVAYPLKPHLFPSKKDAFKASKGPKWNNAAYEGGERKVSQFDTQHRTTTIPTTIPTKDKEWGREKKRRPTPAARKSKQRKKSRGKLKENK